MYLDFHCIRPICGKLNWFAELVQSGRLHITSCWNYLRFYRSSYPASINQLRQIFHWYIALLLDCERDTSTSLVYRILSVFVVQSHASGTDGYGYYHSYLNSKDLQYVSKRLDGSQCSLSYDHWPTSWRRRLSATVCWSGSMIMRPLLMELSKATARTPQKLGCCDRLHLTSSPTNLTSSRSRSNESNQFADYLSHLSTYLHRSSVYGTTAVLFAPSRSTAVLLARSTW